MLNKTLLVIFSLIVPGAGHACRSRWQPAVMFGVASLVAGAALVPLAIKGDAKELALRLILMSVASLVLRVWAAVDSLRGLSEEVRPLWRYGAAAVIAYYVLSALVLRPLMNTGSPQGGARREEVPAAAAAVGQAAGDSLAEEINKLPPGPFASETKGDVFFDRERNSFTIPAGHTAKAEPMFDDANLQQVMIYPHRLYKDLAVGKKTLGAMYEDGLLLLEVQPVTAELAAEPDLPGMYERMMLESVKRNPDWGGKVEKKSGYPLPALAMATREPPLTRLYLFGKKRYFVLKGAALTPAMEAVAATLREAAPEK